MTHQTEGQSLASVGSWTGQKNFADWLFGGETEVTKVLQSLFYINIESEQWHPQICSLSFTN